MERFLPSNFLSKIFVIASPRIVHDEGFHGHSPLEYTALYALPRERQVVGDDVTQRGTIPVSDTCALFTTLTPR